MKIREVHDSDLSQINDICNWHTKNGFSTFGEEASLEERKKWLQRFDSPKHIALVAEAESKIVGVTCSFSYRGGGVFENTIETSIYLAPEWMGKGLGSKLYKELFSRLESTDAHRVVVGIALPNDGSIAIHKKFGFEEIGIFDEYAYYKGEYRSSIWLQKKMNQDFVK